MGLRNTPQELTVLELEARKSFSFALLLTDTRGVAVDLTGVTLEFTRALRWPLPAGAVLTADDIQTIPAASISASEGYVRFDLQAADLDAPAGDYPYSIVMTTLDGYSLLLLKGEIALRENTQFAALEHEYPAAVTPQSLRVVLSHRNVVKIELGSVLPPGKGYLADADQTKLDMLRVTADGVVVDTTGLPRWAQIEAADTAVLNEARQFASTAVAAASVDDRNRALHQGTQPASTIEDLDDVIQSAVGPAVETHRTAAEPHPAYDDLPDLALLFENGLI